MIKRIAIQLGRRRLRNRLTASPCRIVLGAGGIADAGWIATEQKQLDMLSRADWSYYFRTDRVDAMLAEHVWEHLSPRQALLAASNCYRYLRPGGFLRVAVPDGLHPDPQYIQWVCPGGRGPGADDHRVLYTYESFGQVFRQVGFQVRLLEYFDQTGRFHYDNWEPADGLIRRSKRFDTRNTCDRIAYTSIILDAIKPLVLSNQEFVSERAA